MSRTKPTLLHLRHETKEKLRLAVAHSTHRGMSSLADEILTKELDKMLETDESIEQLIEVMRRGQQP